MLFGCLHPVKVGQNRQKVLFHMNNKISSSDQNHEGY